MSTEQWEHAFRLIDQATDVAKKAMDQRDQLYEMVQKLLADVAAFNNKKFPLAEDKKQ